MLPAIAGIETHALGKRFRREWIFRRVTQRFETGRPCAIIGPNGSGKSTFLQVLAGFMPPTDGTVAYQLGDQTVAGEDIFRHLALAAPSLELIEEFTLEELFHFHTRFKPLTLADAQAFLARIHLERARRKAVYELSSGMKQRLKLGLALFSTAPILLLDEPTANLDAQGIAWYRQEITAQLPHRLVLIASNQTYEYDFCDRAIAITEFSV